MALAITACQSPKHDEAAALTMVSRGDTIILGSRSPVMAKLKTEAVATRTYRMQFTTSGVVKAIPANYAEIASPFAGRITKSFVRLGQRVVPGSPVFEISSPDFFETGKIYYQAKQEMDLALKSLNRERDLLHNKVGIRKELEEAEVNYEIRTKDFENAEAALKVFQINPEKMILGQPLVVSSPIAGEVVADKIVIGQYLKEDAEPVIVIANLSKVWVVAHVKEKDLGQISAFDKVEINLVAIPDRSFDGTIYHISEMLDEETRSIEVLIECDNLARRMKPGMYGMVCLSDRETDVIHIPTAAILQEENDCYAVIALENPSLETPSSDSFHYFLKRKIITGITDGDKTIVLNGLTDGDRIVSSGAFYLLDAR
jgi:cobalt-zinc-cadmium efflux system membrane fusion protein